MKEGHLKRAIFELLEKTGAIAVSEVLARGVAILAYHGVTRSRDGSNLRRLHVWEGLFEEHLRFLAGHCLPVPLSTLKASRTAMRQSPPRAVAVTLDDGYRNVLTVALPLLSKFRIPATVFVVTGFDQERRMWIDRLEAVIEASSSESIEWGGRTFSLASTAAKTDAIRALTPMFQKIRARDRETALERLGTQLGGAEVRPNVDRDLLTWDEVRALRDSGLEIGSHAECHEPLTEYTPEVVRSALTRSRKTLEAELGPGQYALSYPYGAWNGQLAVLAREAGFYCAVTTDPGVNGPEADPFGLKRLLVGADDDLPRLRASLTGLRYVARA